VVPALDRPAEAEHPDPLEDLDGAIDTECLLQTRATSGLGTIPDEVVDDPQPPTPDTSSAATEHEVEPDRTRTPEEISDIYNRFRLENEAADRRRRNRIILSIICVIGFAAGGLAVTRTFTRSSTPSEVAPAPPIVSKSELSPEIQPATVDIPSIPEVAEKTPAGGQKVGIPAKSTKPSALSERWSWNAPTAPGTGSDLTLEAEAIAPVVTDAIVASRGEVKVISDMLGSWPASSPKLSAPEPQIKTVVPGKLVSRVNPIFPPMASASGLHGRVELKVAIDKEGAVAKVEQLSGNTMLGSAAAQAVRRWRYEPSQLDGRPVAVEKTIIIDFADPRKK
jgi:TonB family protein